MSAKRERKQTGKTKGRTGRTARRDRRTGGNRGNRGNRGGGRFAVLGRLAARVKAWPAWLRRTAVAGLAGLVLAGAGTWAVESGTADRLAEAAGAQALALSRDAGLAVRAVYVGGRTETDRADLLAAVDVAVGDPILAVDTEAVRRRVEDLGWVARAEVARRLPDTLMVRVVERRAAAIWQRDGEFVLIDREGAVIGGEDVPRFRHLKVVVGPDAPEHAADLLAILNREPALKARVVAAVRMGERRWNLRFDNGVDVRLPADEPSAAWETLARLERDHRVLARALEAIDMRQDDRVIVRMTETGQIKLRGRTEGEET